jgi:Rrf2 family protein
VSGMLTNRARYALKAMLDIAAQPQAVPVALAAVADRQSIPRRFLENILAELKEQGLLEARRGKAGGYMLARPADLITFAEIIRIIDGPLALTPCTSRTAYRRCEDCTDEAACLVRRALLEVRDSTAALLEQNTLASALASPDRTA